MKIQLNGSPYEIEERLTVTALLENLGFADKPVIVELNEEALFVRDFSTTWIEEEARVEIVTLAAGG